MQDALKAALADKNLPDVWLESGADLKARVKDGYLYPISDFPDYPDLVKTFPQPKVDFVPGSNIIDGKTYAAPFEARGGMWNMLYINTKVFKDAGIVDDKGEAKIPQTLDEMEADCQKIKEAANGAYCFASPFSEFLGALFPRWWGTRSGGPFDGTDPQTGKSLYGQNKVYNRILEFIATGRDQGWIHPQSASANDEAIRALFAEGEVGIIPGGAWNLNGWQQTLPDFKDYVPAAPPLINTDKQLGWYDSGHGGAFLLIGSTTKHPQEAWKLFKWIHSKEAGRRWVESGNGTSIWPENNDPKIMPPLLATYYQITTENSRAQPFTTKPKDMDKVVFGDTKPNEVAILQGVFAGQITDIDKALKELGAAKDKMREQAFEDARKAGAKNVGFEYLAVAKQFPGWDPSAGKDFVPQD
jgi:ABC-type glycerol-3-phosphate transport system substrate-binding protein